MASNGNSGKGGRLRMIEIIGKKIELAGGYENFIRLVEEQKGYLGSEERQYLLENKDKVLNKYAREEQMSKGAYYTPTDVVKSVWEMLDKGVPGWRDGEYVIWDASCYGMGVECFTDKGFKRWEQLEGDERVLGVDPYGLDSEWVDVEGSFKKSYKGAMYRFYARGICDFEVTEDHLLSVVKVEDGVCKLEKVLARDYESAREGYLLCGVMGKEVSDGDIIDELLGYMLTGGYKGDNGTMIYLKDCDYVRTRYTGYLLETGVKGLVGVLLTGLGEKYNEYVKDMSKLRGYLLDRRGAVMFAKGVMRGQEEWELGSHQRGLRYVEEIFQVAGGYSVSRGKFGGIKVVSGGVVFLPYKCLKVEVEYKECEVWDLTMVKYHNFLLRSKGMVFVGSNCGGGGLLRGSGVDMSKVYMSTIDPFDVESLKGDKNYEGATIFQSDFLADVDIKGVYEGYLDSLPDGLQSAIRGGKKILFINNPPYEIQKGGGLAEEFLREKVGSSPLKWLLWWYKIYKWMEQWDLEGSYALFITPQNIEVSREIESLLERGRGKYSLVLKDSGSSNGYGVRVTDTWSISRTLWGYKQGVSDVGDKGYYERSKGLVDYLAPKGVLFYESRLSQSGRVYLSELGGRYKMGKVVKGSIGSMEYYMLSSRSDIWNRITNLSWGTRSSVDITEENILRCVGFNVATQLLRLGAKEKGYFTIPYETNELYQWYLYNSFFYLYVGTTLVPLSLRDIKCGGSSFNVYNTFYLRDDTYLYTNNITRGLKGDLERLNGILPNKVVLDIYDMIKSSGKLLGAAWEIDEYLELIDKKLLKRETGCYDIGHSYAYKLGLIEETDWLKRFELKKKLGKELKEMARELGYLDLITRGGSGV